MATSISFEAGSSADDVAIQKIILADQWGRRARLTEVAEIATMSYSSIETLPNEIIDIIIAKVVGSSLSDLFTCRFSCKKFDAIGQKECILHRVNIENYLFLKNQFRTSDENPTGAYFRLCLQSKNPGALFIQGMEDYFISRKKEDGILNLREAATLGHVTAAYIIGLLFTCGIYTSTSEKQMGFDLLKDVKKRIGKGIVACRIKVKRFVERSWWKDELFLTHTTLSFPTDHVQCCIQCHWVLTFYCAEDEDYETTCTGCMYAYESLFFNSLLAL